MYKVLVFGTLPIATKVVMAIEKMENVNLVGVVTTDEHPTPFDPWDVPLLNDYIIDHNIKRYKLEELPQAFGNKEIDLGITCRYGKILKKQVIDLFQIGIVNLHGGLLPEFGGLNSANFSILKDSPVGGGTIHFIDEGIDTGDVIKRCEFEMDGADTAFTVFQKTQQVLYENIISLIPELLSGNVKKESIASLVEDGHESHYYDRYSIAKYREVSVDEIIDGTAMKKVRAFDFPMHEPAYLYQAGRKVYLRTSAD